MKIKRLTVTVAVALILALSGAQAAFATGQPGAPTNTCGDMNPVTPGASATSMGSPLNPDGTAGTVYEGNPGTASLANANSQFAVSQYDVACVQLSH